MSTRSDRRDVREEADSLLLGAEPTGLRKQVTTWLRRDGNETFAGGAKSHRIDYEPSSWQGIVPWPRELEPQEVGDMRTVSRGQVMDVASRCATSGDWRHLLVASYVWGYGVVGYGPSRLRRVLKNAEDGQALTRAVTELGSDARNEDSGAVRAYRVLSGKGHIAYFGPAFFTKFLYFAGQAVQVDGQKPLILDAVMAGAVRGYVADLLGGDKQAKSDAQRVWPKGGWSAYRYGCYVDLMNRVASGIRVDSRLAVPADVVELAVFKTAR